HGLDVEVAPRRIRFPLGDRVVHIEEDFGLRARDRKMAFTGERVENATHKLYLGLAQRAFEATAASAQRAIAVHYGRTNLIERATNQGYWRPARDLAHVHNEIQIGFAGNAACRCDTFDKALSVGRGQIALRLDLIDEVVRQNLDIERLPGRVLVLARLI